MRAARGMHLGGRRAAARRRRADGGRSRLALVGLALLLLAAVPAVAALPGEGGREGPGSGRPFVDGSAWNVPIPKRVTLDPDSDAIVAHLTEEGFGNANLEEYAVPVYEADSATPRVSVTCTRSWGRCDLEQAPVPIPEGATPSPGSDGAMVVVDRASGRSYDFWQARRSFDGSWTTSWGGIVDLSADGYTPGAAQTGSGVPRLAGVVRVAEIEQGEIPHALAFATDNACQGDYRYPASKTDGWSSAEDCIPEGARIQLDPDIDLDALEGLTPAERTVARALQTHGAYAMDNAGTKMAFIFETAEPGATAYRRAGLLHDYHRLDGIPWERLRVLRRWDGR